MGDEWEELSTLRELYSNVNGNIRHGEYGGVGGCHECVWRMGFSHGNYMRFMASICEKMTLAESCAHVCLAVCAFVTCILNVSVFTPGVNERVGFRGAGSICNVGGGGVTLAGGLRVLPQKVFNEVDAISCILVHFKRLLDTYFYL